MYLEPLTDDLFTAWYNDCIFNENNFPILGGDYKVSFRMPVNKLG
jgi:hypothetical protein